MLELEDEVRYRLVDSEETRKKYPFPFCLEIGYRIEGKKIEVLWKVINTGTREMHFQIGAHPAFYYPDYDTETTDRGYFGFDKTEGLHYILISEKGCAAPDKEYLLELTDGLLPLDIHSFDKDALILENSQVKEVTLYNKEKKPISVCISTLRWWGCGRLRPRMLRLSASSRGTGVVTVPIIRRI